MKLKHLFIVFSLLTLSFASQAKESFRKKCENTEGGASYYSNQAINSLSTISFGFFKTFVTLKKNEQSITYGIHVDNFNTTYALVSKAYFYKKNINICVRRNSYVGQELIGAETI